MNMTKLKMVRETAIKSFDDNYRENMDISTLYMVGFAVIIAFGVVPQVITAWIAVVLYRFEVNLRSATVLGMVGAGGLGFELVSSLKLFRYQETATCIIVITVTPSSS
jgi:ABC-type phosphate/phosphonate transport system permease subunit